MNDRAGLAGVFACCLTVACSNSVRPETDASMDSHVAQDRAEPDRWIASDDARDVRSLDAIDAGVDVTSDQPNPVPDSGCVEPAERPARTLRSCSGPNGAPAEHCREVWTCGGAFRMGDPDAWLYASDPFHMQRMRERPCTYGMTTVNPGYIDAYPVSVARWRRWVDAGMPQPEEGARFFDQVIWSRRRLSPRGGPENPLCTWSPTPGVNDNLPINCVGTAEAAVFCWWEGKHIVTEQMWEFVARNSGTTAMPYSRRAVEPFDPCRYGDILRYHQCAANLARFGEGLAPIDAFPEGRTSFPEGVFIFGGVSESVRINRLGSLSYDCLDGAIGEATYSSGGFQQIWVNSKGVSYRLSPEQTEMASNPASYVPRLLGGQGEVFRCARWPAEPVSGD